MRRGEHRRSTDIDITIRKSVPGQKTPTLMEMTSDWVFGLQARRMDKWMKERGAKVLISRPNHRLYEFRTEGESNKIEIFEPVTYEEKPHERGTINGEEALIVTTKGILEGKIVGRGDRSPARDLYDIAVAYEKAPAALTAAIEDLEASEWGGTPKA